MIRDSHYKKCTDCGKIISFSEFLKDNPAFIINIAKDLWYDSMISIYCPECYFSRPEKPFKTKRGYFNYYRRFRKKTRLKY
jgi:hypothetical protein